MGWSQGLESWSGLRLPYWSGFLKWNPGGNVASGTGTTLSIRRKTDAAFKTE